MIPPPLDSKPPPLRHNVTLAAVVSPLLLLITLAFWAGFVGWLMGVSLLPGLGLALLGVILIASQRTALECQVCGFVRPRS